MPALSATSATLRIPRADTSRLSHDARNDSLIFRRTEFCDCMRQFPAVHGRTRNSEDVEMGVNLKSSKFTFSIRLENSTHICSNRRSQHGAEVTSATFRAREARSSLRRFEEDLHPSIGAFEPWNQGNWTLLVTWTSICAVAHRRVLTCERVQGSLAPRCQRRKCGNH